MLRATPGRTFLCDGRHRRTPDWAGARADRPHGKFTAGDALIGPQQVGSAIAQRTAGHTLPALPPILFSAVPGAAGWGFAKMGLFSSKTPQEVMRENKRMLDRSIRELDRERTMIEGQVKKTLGEMKKMAKAGQEVRGRRGDDGR